MIRLANFCFLKINSLEPLRPMSTSLGLKKPRYNGSSKKRRWEDRRADKGDGLYTKIAKTDESFVRIKRKKFAMLLGYSGVNYYGMQRNPFSKTIEEDLCKALLDAELISSEAFSQMQTIHFQRAARTDKGVSAAKQVVSLKLPESVDISKINSFLPETIRVFGVKRVTKGFNSKSQCNARTYMYMLPTIALSDSSVPLENQEAYSLSEERHDEVNSLLKKFEGTHNFHNYTNKKKPNDPSAKRYMMCFHCEKPFSKEGTEFAILKVKGQSFMLHQIRKMVGIAVAILRGYTTLEIFEKSFTTESVNIPKAPGLGLVLEEVHYDRYNVRYGKDGIHDTLEWKEYEQEINDFKEKYIYPTIIDTEVKEKQFIDWMQRRLMNHDFAKVEEESSIKTEENGENDEQSSDEECEDVEDQEDNQEDETDLEKSEIKRTESVGNV